MRAALRGLTTRGRCLIAAGIAAAGCALLLGEKDLLRVAVFLLVLPLLSVGMLARARFKLTCSRRLTPERIAVGQSSEVSLVLRNVSLLPTTVLLLEDDLPYALGGRPRFTVERIGSQHERTVEYSVRSEVRGRYGIGPLRLRLTDAFGLVELTRSFSVISKLTVVPAALPLPAVSLSGSRAVGAGTTARSMAARGEDDAVTREYRHGDDLRKVHWRSTARVGKLMVRREERPWQARAAVLLDTRTVAHRGEAPAASIEWAISAVASIGVHLMRRGFVVTVFTDDGLLLDSSTGPEVLLDRLADIQTSRNRDFSAITSSMLSTPGSGGGGTLIAVLGSLRAEQAAEVAALRTGTVTGMAMLLDTTTWLGVDAASRARSAEVTGKQAEAFSAHAWRAAPVQRRSSVQQVWSTLGGLASPTERHLNAGSR
ncbi:MAG TPA: DUF58 domain-containing protein [Mycobacteriales bacterium]|nr:DUF58 domain-containing protein [Mycobacteriales bacterium]